MRKTTALITVVAVVAILLVTWALYEPVKTPILENLSGPIRLGNYIYVWRATIRLENQEDIDRKVGFLRKEIDKMGTAEITLTWVEGSPDMAHVEIMVFCNDKLPNSLLCHNCHTNEANNNK